MCIARDTEVNSLHIVRIINTWTSVTRSNFELQTKMNVHNPESVDMPRVRTGSVAIVVFAEVVTPLIRR